MNSSVSVRTDAMSPAKPLMRVLIEDTELVFSCRAQQPILDAAFEAGVALPYACRRGICGLCAADLLQGHVAAVDALPLINERCTPTQVLLCRCTPADEAILLRPTSWQLLAKPRRLPTL